ncbi:hypothetical protein [Catenuloplanes atrovinosus]|uniref:Uncharacterized protein n=1 Tax=Catenuloplanes atrovinosus TaxID=137266 RepID=A0AAE4C9T0_9ACTN|nr:hypothetical protein [Catenuloplanes atrovinosus]MDR7273900.1 hypothetical protein [Catenuloplanes atrovinosus]
MASVPSRGTRTATAPFTPEWPPRATTTVTRRPQRARTPRTERRAGTVRRWAFRLLLAAPFVALAVAWTGDVTANAAIERDGMIIRWGADDLGFVSALFPPLPAAVAGLAPFGTRGLGVAGALLAGVVLGVLWDRLRRYGLPRRLAAVLLAGLGAMPAFGALAVSDFHRFATVALFSVALAGMVRFAVDGDTGGGFTCGLAMGAAVLCDLYAVLFTVMLAVTCAVIIRWRGFGGTAPGPGMLRATALVITFPAAAAVCGWAFLEWRFAGTFFQGVRDSGWGPSVLTGGWAALAEQPWRELGEAVLRTPVLLAALLLALVNGRWLLSLLLPVPPLLIALAVALGVPLTPGEALLVLGAAALVVPVPSGRVAVAVLTVAASCQVGLGWFW